MHEKPSKLRAILFGGLLVGIVAGSPVISILNKCCCCGGVMLCGMISFYLYKQEFNDETPPFESSDALVLGIIAGLAGALIATVIALLSTFILGPIDTHIAIRLLTWLESQPSLPPDSLNKIDELKEVLQKSIDEGIKLKDIFSDLLIGLILYPVFSMLGGLIGYGIFGKKKPAVPIPPPMQQ
jgi:hypothetical protein